MPDTAVELSFADGRYTFWLALPQVIELERKGGGKSIFTMYDQIGAGLGIVGEQPVYAGGGSAMLTDIRETIRLGLIGGNSGMVSGAQIEVGPNLARDLVDTYNADARTEEAQRRLALSEAQHAVTRQSLATLEQQAAEWVHDGELRSERLSDAMAQAKDDAAELRREADVIRRAGVRTDCVTPREIRESGL
ncbi:GTA-gp10 family protein [Croceibacterium ferulae]|uniref:GTA-gp10 family protein n=1 Tax=Croceibacterium ferulae TaxID=1854641 RepID=UPI000EB4A73F|nr:GTA-gp10 family protein [Croceibacterium ferulae]